MICPMPGIALPVALRKESVDRNLAGMSERLIGSVSLSARRAWIEISRPLRATKYKNVALRKESVDRNIRRCLMSVVFLLSLSARRAWIEMNFFVPFDVIRPSLSARRAWIEICYMIHPL